MSSTITPIPASAPAVDARSTTTLADAKMAVANASSEIASIDYELNRLALAKAQATARFNFACARMAELQNKHKEAIAS